MKIALAVFTAALLPALAQGAVTSTVVFETNAQSMWDTGSGTTFDYQESLRQSLSTPRSPRHSGTRMRPDLGAGMPGPGRRGILAPLSITQQFS